jgi:hypothetical protein
MFRYDFGHENLCFKGNSITDLARPISSPHIEHCHCPWTRQKPSVRRAFSDNEGFLRPGSAVIEMLSGWSSWLRLRCFFPTFAKTSLLYSWENTRSILPASPASGQLDVRPQGQGGRANNDIFAFLTTEPNAGAGAIYPKAMPVILTTPDEVEARMTTPPAGPPT